MYLKTSDFDDFFNCGNRIYHINCVYNPFHINFISITKLIARTQIITIIVIILYCLYIDKLFKIMALLCDTFLYNICPHIPKLYCSAC